MACQIKKKYHLDFFVYDFLWFLLRARTNVILYAYAFLVCFLFDYNMTKFSRSIKTFKQTFHFGYCSNPFRGPQKRNLLDYTRSDIQKSASPGSSTPMPDPNFDLSFQVRCSPSCELEQQTSQAPPIIQVAPFYNIPVLHNHCAYLSPSPRDASPCAP